MEEKIYKVVLADGVVIDNLRLNGNNLISKKAIDSSIFEGNCSSVVISDGETNEIHENMELVQITEPVEGEYWFVLREVSEDELARIKMQSDIEYVAMMSGVEL
jgi:hypothetical protein